MKSKTAPRPTLWCARPNHWAKGREKDSATAVPILDDDLAHGDARYLAAHAEEGEARTGPDDLQPVGSEAERQLDDAVEVVREGPPLDERPHEHQSRGEHAGDAYAPAVEHDAAHEEQEEEDVEVAVAAGEEAVFVARPAQSALLHGECEQRLQGRHDVGEEIPERHRGAQKTEG